MAVQLAEGPDCQADVSRLRRRLAVLPIIGVGMMEICETQLIDGGIRPGRRGREASAVGEPLGQKPVILGPALRGAISAEINVPAIKGGNGLIGGLVVPIRWRTWSGRRHGPRLPIR